MIVVIAVLGILSLILVPQFSLYGDKAMGTTAAADARTAISVCSAHNMDSIEPLSQDFLNTYMSLVAEGTAGRDASSSKYMQLVNTDHINYWYRRGDAVLYGDIDLVNGNTTWTCNLTSVNRFNSLAQGLKVNGVAAGSANTTSTAAVGTLGFSATVAWTGNTPTAP